MKASVVVPPISDIWDDLLLHNAESCLTLIDVRPRPSSHQPLPPIPLSFPLPIDLFTSRSAFPWFLLPDKPVPFGIVVPDPSPTTYPDLLQQRDVFPWELNHDHKVNNPLLHLSWIVHLIHHLTVGGWNLMRIYIANDKLLSSIPPSLSSSSHHSFILPFRPSPMIVDSGRIVMESHSHVHVLDLGCGAGRDIAYLFGQYRDRIRATAVDSWKGSIHRVLAMSHLLNIPSNSLIPVHAELLPFGQVKTKRINNNNDQSLPTIDIMNPVVPYQFIIIHRFLPPRSFAPTLHSLIDQSCSRPVYIFIATFVLPTPTMSLDDWVHQYHSPTSFANLLHPGELVRPLNLNLANLSETQIMNQIDQWGWGFTCDRGYTIIRDDVITLSDGRTLQWLLVCKY